MKKFLKLLLVTFIGVYLVSCAKPLDYGEEPTKKETAKQTETTKKETKETTTKATEETTIETTEEAIVVINKIKSFEIDKKTGFKVVKFGKYDESIGTNQDIEWLMLDKNDTSYLLLSRYVLDCKNYNDTDESVNFRNSTLNEWLNTYFLDRAFTEDEKEYLNKVSTFALAGGNVVSIPDIALCKNYFGEPESDLTNYRLSSKATNYAKSNHVEYVDALNTDFADCASFFLSDNGTGAGNVAAWVGRYGRIYEDGQKVKLEYGDGVRPVITLSKKVFEDDEVVINPNIVPEETEEETTIAIDKSQNIYKNTIKAKYKSTAAPTIPEGTAIDINTEGSWEYGRTPLEWIYVGPNMQIICNNKPNSSTNFSYKAQASSGDQGCYIPIFTNSKSHGEDYEGRFYSISDYTKFPPEEMSFNNKFENLVYKDYKVIDILKEKYEIGKISAGIWAANGEYINVVYISELEEIIKNMK